MQFVLGFFGYVKIPVSVVQLSMKQENMWKQIVDNVTTVENKEIFGLHLKAQRTLTNFLRSGRLL
jgi:hypothetical protein